MWSSLRSSRSGPSRPSRVRSSLESDHSDRRRRQRRRVLRRLCVLVRVVLQRASGVVRCHAAGQRVVLHRGRARRRVARRVGDAKVAPHLVLDEGRRPDHVELVAFLEPVEEPDLELEQVGLDRL